MLKNWDLLQVRMQSGCTGYDIQYFYTYMTSLPQGAPSERDFLIIWFEQRISYTIQQILDYENAESLIRRLCILLNNIHTKNRKEYYISIIYMTKGDD